MVNVTLIWPDGRLLKFDTESITINGEPHKTGKHIVKLTTAQAARILADAKDKPADGFVHCEILAFIVAKECMN